MSERDPGLVLNLGGNRKVEMSPDNAMLYTFAGRTAIGDTVIENDSLNHIFVVTSKPDQDPPSGIYFFKEFDTVYDEIAAHMVEHQYPMTLNQRAIPACDLEAWTKRVDETTTKFAKSIPNSVPADLS